MDYFNKSQIVKSEILRNPTLLETTKQAFGEKLEPFSFGGTVNFYQIGRLHSGLYLGLRTFRTNVDEGKNNLRRQVRLMEYYCQNADYLDSHGDSVPQFCVGVINKAKAGIFTEDLSNGGTQEITHHSDNNYVIVGSDKRKMFVDIDIRFRYTTNLELKYFLEENSILLL